jgi:predicted RNase H-like HicB family nuclease
MAKKASVNGPSDTQGRKGGRQQGQGQGGPNSTAAAAPRAAAAVNLRPGHFFLEQAIVGPSVAAAPPGQAVSVYSCPVYLVPEDGGGYSAGVTTLPGCYSQGDTLEEAVANIVEALEGVLETYKDRGMPVPWRKRLRKPRNAILYRVLVHA